MRLLKKIALFFSILLPSLSFALGDLAHNYVAEGAAAQTDGALKSVLTTYQSEYLVGSDYPDTGYLPGFNFGEDSHWPYFVTPFADYIRNTCQDAKTVDQQTHCDQMTAFLLGVATHVKSDIVSHWTYYNFVAQHDFGALNPTNWNKAHSAMDPASDFYTIVRKGIYDHPVTWWVPVDDLVKIYAEMKQNKVITDTITADEIIKANAIYYVALGLTEDLVAYPVYTYDALYNIPWGIAHLDDPDPQYGAFPEMIRQSAIYIQDVWSHIHGSGTLWTMTPKKMDVNSTTTQVSEIVKNALDNHLITITPEKDNLGAVTFTPTSLKFSSPAAQEKFNSQIMVLQSQMQKHA
ncbi:MAG: zinc dependent phospholipase C family protein [Coxiellaceae bacterium]|nr:zinc dependent phospholipase C family protein [Coxiellaceae bacterium]